MDSWTKITRGTKWELPPNTVLHYAVVYIYIYLTNSNRAWASPLSLSFFFFFLTAVVTSKCNIIYGQNLQFWLKSSSNWWKRRWVLLESVNMTFEWGSLHCCSVCVCVCVHESVYAHTWLFSVCVCVCMNLCMDMHVCVYECVWNWVDKWEHSWQAPFIS